MNSDFFILSSVIIASGVAVVTTIFKELPGFLNEKKEAMVSDFKDTCEQSGNDVNKSQISNFVSKYEDIPKYHDYRINLLIGFLGLAAISIVYGFIDEISIIANLSTYVVSVILFIFVMITLIVRILPSFYGLKRISKQRS